MPNMYERLFIRTEDLINSTFDKLDVMYDRNPERYDRTVRGSFAIGFGTVATLAELGAHKLPQTTIINRLGRAGLHAIAGVSVGYTLYMVGLYGETIGEYQEAANHQTTKPLP